MTFVHNSRGNQVVAAMMACISIAMTCGCSKTLSTDYGSNQGVLAKRSINGFTTLREAFDKANYQLRDLRRLTDRSRSVSAVVWTPIHPSGIEQETTRWFERWLRQGNRTLIYVVPDSGSESQFYRDARPTASPEQRLEYRRKYAESLINEHRWQLRRTAIKSNGWFTIRPEVQQTRLKAGRELHDNSALQNESRIPRRIEWMVQPFDADDANDASKAGTVIWEPAGPGGQPWNVAQNVTATKTPVEFESLLESETGETVMARITSETWNDSQIIVVAGGSLLTNYALTQPENQRLAETLISRVDENLISGGSIDPETKLTPEGSTPKVAFATANGVMPISAQIDEVPRKTGAEMLTVFPISFVTIHMAILGFSICLMLMPVFGRPRRVVRGVLTHFGDHLDAVATLMQRRGGEAYARKRISEYMKNVREETSGPWVIDEPNKTANLLQADSDPVHPASQDIPPVASATATVQTVVDRTNDAPKPLDRG